MSTLPAPSSVRFEHHVAGSPALGLGTPTPRVSWQLTDAPEGYRQGA